MLHIDREWFTTHSRTPQGQPGAGSSSTAAGQWRVEAVSAEAASAAAGGGVATAAAGGGAAATAAEQTGAGSGFTGQPKVSLRYGGFNMNWVGWG